MSTAAKTGCPPWAPLLLVIAGLAAYAGSFSGPFVFDDVASIVENPTLRHWESSLTPPLASTTSGRPLVNLSLAANYAVSGTAVWSYHAVNVAIHVLAALVLLGLIRRTLAADENPAAAVLAAVAALLWMLHPLQTEAVTYVVQRAESLMGLCYLLTLYAFRRGAESASLRPRWWFAVSLTACFLGMATKEVMVSAPLIALLYDRTFLAGSFREAWRLRARVYLGLGASWLLLALLVLSGQGRNGTAGFGGAIPWTSYALTQFPAITHYLWLSLWPRPLIFYYGRAVVTDPWRAGLPALFILVLLIATGWALVRRPALGFLGAFFFLILAPSSSVVPVATETMAEHRMYLALIPVVVGAVLGLHAWRPAAVLPAGLTAAAVLAVLTWQRNAVYGDALGLWEDTVAHRPANPWARNEFGSELARRPNRLEDAAAQFREALRLKPDYVDAHNNLGNTLLRLPGRANEALIEYQAAVRLAPANAVLRSNLGNALVRLPGRGPEARAQYEAAIRLNPDFPETRYALANLLANAPENFTAAIAQYREALRLRPDYIEAHTNLGNVLLKTAGGTGEAIAQYREALRLNPGYVQAHYNLATALRGIPGRRDEAMAEYEEVLRLDANRAEAQPHFDAFLRVWPNAAEARELVAQAQGTPP